MQWIKKIEAASSLKDLINPKSITRKDLSDYEKLDLIMAAELKWCYDIAYLIYEITQRRAVTRQKKGEKLLGRLKNVFHGRQLDIVQKETPHKHATGDGEDNVGFSPRARILFSTESEDTD